MRKPKPEEKVRCPEARSERMWTPKEVWDNGSYGVLGPHRHGAFEPECDRSHLPVPIVKAEEKG